VPQKACFEDRNDHSVHIRDELLHDVPSRSGARRGSCTGGSDVAGERLRRAARAFDFGQTSLRKPPGPPPRPRDPDSSFPAESGIGNRESGKLELGFPPTSGKPGVSPGRLGLGFPSEDQLPVQHLGSEYSTQPGPRASCQCSRRQHASAAASTRLVSMRLCVTARHTSERGNCHASSASSSHYMINGFPWTSPRKALLIDPVRSLVLPVVRPNRNMLLRT
jgi:hypothetical protein